MLALISNKRSIIVFIPVLYIHSFTFESVESTFIMDYYFQDIDLNAYIEINTSYASCIR